jgi:hypothetical protein
MPGISVRHWFLILTLLLLFIGLCAVVFAGELGQQPGPYDLQSESPAILNVSRQQCEKVGQLAHRFYSDTAITRGKIVEKRFEPFDKTTILTLPS